jgi:glycosyltransferase involved in cell wall biosynthesis
VSSFLTHRAKDVTVFKKNFWIMPSAVKGIPIHKSIEKVIIISRGFIHGLNLPPNVEKYLYILDWDLVDQESLGWQKMFAPYVNEWREKALTKYLKIAVSSESLKLKLELPNTDVIHPTYKTEEYPFVRDEDHHFIFTHQLVYTHDLSVEEFRKIISYLDSKGETVRVLGPDSHLESIKKEFPKVEFGGDHCDATNALYSHQAKVVWDFSRSLFPSKSFGALATGRPVVVRDEANRREFLTDGAYFLASFHQEFIQKVYQDVEENYLNFDRKKLRRLGLKWNERLFKSKMAKFLNK